MPNNIKGMTRSKPTITIGISAYQSEANISQLLESLTKQDEKQITIEKLIVYCDGCTDNTVDKANKIKKKSRKKIIIIDSPKNLGYAHSVQKIIDSSKSDFIVLLNDDILVKSRKLISNLISTMSQNENIGFASGDIRALKPTNFIGECVKTSFDAFRFIRRVHRSGNSLYTADGKIMTLRKKFAQTISLHDTDVSGNVDIYIYFLAITSGWQYAFSPQSPVYCRLPETINDYRSQKERAVRSKIMLQKHFGTIVDQEFALSKKLYLKSVIKIFLKKPIESMVFKVLLNNFFFLQGSKTFKKWRLAHSTKNLKHDEK